MMHRELSGSFLSLMDYLNFSAEERKIADNYFTLLRNDFTEIWHDQGIELGGGQPFTVGTEGEQRNKLHIVSKVYCRFVLAEVRIQGNALTYLDEFLDSSRGNSYIQQHTRSGIPREMIHAVCSGGTCLLSASLPGPVSNRAHQVGAARELLPMAANSPAAMRSLGHELSRAVDADPNTYFESHRGSTFFDIVSSLG